MPCQWGQSPERLGHHVDCEMPTSILRACMTAMAMAVVANFQMLRTKRRQRLFDTLHREQDDTLRIGCALHSLRAVPPDAMTSVLAALQFRRSANPAGIAAAVVWLGENLFNIARYMADARAQDLPLVGNGDHDWTEIFSRWHVLHLDGRIAGITRGVGLVLMALAVVWLYRRWRARDSRPS